MLSKNGYLCTALIKPNIQRGDYNSKIRSILLIHLSQDPGEFKPLPATPSVIGLKIYYDVPFIYFER